MRRPALLFCICLSLLAPAVPAAAAVFTLASYDVSLHHPSVDYGLVLSWEPRQSTPASWSLSAGDQATFRLFRVGTDENTVSYHDLDHFPISVAFDFSSPSLQGNVSGESWGTVESGDDRGHVRWDDPVEFHFGTTGLFTIDLTDVGFGTPAWTSVWATLTYARADTEPVPEPSTMLLFGSGLVGLVVFRKRFRKA
jgi:hypothetical protein